MTGNEFIRKVQKLGRNNAVTVVFVARRGKGSHGTLYYGDRFTIVRNLKDELKRGTATRNSPQSQSPANGDPCFEQVVVSNTFITAHLSDGCRISVPLCWSWRLEQASPEQRNHCEIIGAGRIAHWPDVDEHLSVNGFLHGTPAPRPKSVGT